MQADKKRKNSPDRVHALPSPKFIRAMPPNIPSQRATSPPNSPFPIEHESPHRRTSHGSPSRSHTQSAEERTTGPTFLSRLSHLPTQRPLPWRLGQELPPERSLDSERVQQRGASLLATRGDVAGEPCSQCVAGQGRFTHCIALGNWFQGACASCVFTSRGNRCSLRLLRGMLMFPGLVWGRKGGR